MAKARRIETTYNDSRENVHSVSTPKWRSWSEDERRLFNRIYSEMMQNQSAFSHPKAPEMDAEHYQTIAWNAAWTAADHARELRIEADKDAA